MRITENLIAMNFLSRTANALSRMAEAQERLASGKKLLRPADDPAALAKARDELGREGVPFRVEPIFFGGEARGATCSS